MDRVCNIAFPIMLILMFNDKKIDVMMKTMIKSVIAGALALRRGQSWLQKLRPYQGIGNIDSVGIL